MSIGDIFGFFNYVSDNGNTYVVKLSFHVANQGSFGVYTGQIGAAVIWPYGAKNMRHVYGISTGNKRARIPIASNGGALYVTGGTFTNLAGTAFTTEGAIGEARKLNAVA